MSALGHQVVKRVMEDVHVGLPMPSKAREHLQCSFLLL